jgi:2-methylaconitate cis-trans-isomerase PrpF
MGTRTFCAAGDIAIPCSVYRGGTSRGVLMRSADVPYPREVVERVLLRVFGSPDARQIDGLGGGNSQTSKAMFVDPASGHADDVAMTLAQVAVSDETVDWGGNCGNMTAAVGAFAIDAGLVAATDPVTVVRILSRNTGVRVAAHVPVRNGVVVSDGDYEIPGVPGRGAKIVLQWFSPAGSVTGRLLPTGRPLEVLHLRDGRAIDVSIVDAVNPVVFCEANAVGLTGTELPEELARRRDAMETLEEVRSIAAEMLSIVPSRDVATATSPGLPKVAIVASARDYRTVSGATLPASSHDLHARLMSMQTPHRSYAVSGGICTAVAAAIDGTLVHARSTSSRDGEAFRIAHPYGVMDVALDLVVEEGAPVVRSAKVGRTARRIMSGHVHVPASVFREVTAS